MMKKINKWIRKQVGAIVIATSNVEKNALGQEDIDVATDTAKFQRYNQGTLADSLVNGEITEEVKNLRWRMLKILDASDKYIVNSLGVDEDGFPILDTEQPDATGQRVLLNKINLDEYDDYPLELVVNNNEITMSTSDIMDNDNIKAYDHDDIIKEVDISGNTISATLGEIDNDAYQSFIKSDKPIKVVRDFRPKFEIEKYTKKLNIRKISETEKLLEFYVSMYPDEYDRKTRLLISEIKRAIKNPRSSDMLDIVGVGFTSYKTVGVKDFHQFQYKINSFDKIIEYNGYYVIKFKGDVIVNGEYLLEKYRMEGLDNKYTNKEAKK
jgi:hypothetical protein